MIEVKLFTYIKSELLELKLTDRQLDQIALDRVNNFFTPIGELQGDYSYSFDLDWELNKSALSGVGFTTSLDKLYNKRLRCKLEFDGTDLLNNSGFLRVLGRKKNVVTVKIYSGNTDWRVQLQGKTIRQVNYAELDHTYDAAGIAGRAEPSASEELYRSGYWYTPQNVGQLPGSGAITDTSEIFAVGNAYPTIFTRWILEKAFSEIGYRLEGDLINHPVFKDAGLPFNGDLFFGDNGRELLAETGQDERYTVSAGFPDDLLFSEIITDGLNEFVVGTRTTFTPLNDVNATITVSFDIGDIDQSLSVSARLIRDDGAANTIASQTQTVTTGGSDVTFDLAFTGDLVEGDDYYIEVEASPLSGNVSFDVRAGATWEIVRNTENIFAGATWEFAKNIPEIGILDLLDFFVTNMQGSIYTDSVNRVIYLRLPNSYLSNIAANNTIDITEYLDLDTIEVDFVNVLAEYGQNNLITWAESENDNGQINYNKTNAIRLGDGNFTINNGNLPAQKIIKENSLVPTLNILDKNSRSYLPSLPLQVSTTELQEIGDRILLYSVQDVSTISAGRRSNFDLPDGSDTSRVAYGYFALTELASPTLPYSLAYSRIANQQAKQKTLLEAFWELRQSILARPYRLKADLYNLPISLYREKDVTMPFVISEPDYKGYYILEKIEGYSRNRSATGYFVLYPNADFAGIQPNIFVAPPVNLVASFISGDPTVEWDNNGSSATFTELEFSTDQINWTKLATIPINQASYTDDTADRFYRARHIKVVDGISYFSAYSNTANAVTEIIFDYAAFNNNGTYKAFDDGRGTMLEIIPRAGIDPIDIEIIADNANDQDKVTVTNTTATFEISDANANNPVLTNGAGDYQFAIKITDSATGVPAFDRVRSFTLAWMAAFGDFPGSFFAFSNVESLSLTQIKGAGGAGFNQFPSQIARIQNLTSFRQFRAFEENSAKQIDPTILQITALEELEWGDVALGDNVNVNGLAAGNLDGLASSLPNLTSLRLLGTGLNLLPNLSSLELNLFQVTLGNLIPATELSNLSPLISNLGIQGVSGNVSLIDVGDYTNLSSLSFQNSQDIDADKIPTNLVDAEFNIFDVRNCFKTQIRSDTFIDTFYDYAVANGSISGTGNFNGFTLDYRSNTTPSGTFQAPSGYVNHISNGTPASQQEKMFVLINNYNITILT